MRRTRIEGNRKIVMENSENDGHNCNAEESSEADEPSISEEKEILALNERPDSETGGLSQAELDERDAEAHFYDTTQTIQIKNLKHYYKNFHKPVYFFVKRCFDLFVSFLLIIILSPLLLIVALLVKCTSKGPIIFADKRVGKGGKTIHVYKFRSMYVDAEDRLKKYLTPEQYRQWQVERKVDNDPRITKVGKFIRKTSIDELPQLFNILFGSMSFVGPRPISKMEFDENYTPEGQAILNAMKPGLFSNWAVRGRSNVTFQSGERQKLELDYFNKRSVWYDIKLMFLLIPAVFSHNGAK